VSGRPPPPSGYVWQNSTLFPRRPGSEAGYWRFDYASLFEPAFAPHFGFEDPDAPGTFLPLCELVERGLVHEVWVVGSADVPDVNAAEVLEAKPRYTLHRNRIPGAIERCAGNGCFDSDVPVCDRSVRVGFVNYTRGPGCYLHSHGHGLEWTANSGAIPALTEWFRPFANMDLVARHGLPVDSWYGASPCSQQEPCVTYPHARSVRLRHQGQAHDRSPFDSICGNVHFPPNARWHYDYGHAQKVESSCEGYGQSAGPGGFDALAEVSAASWARYAPLAPDCGGEFLVWWYQNMPGHGSGQRFPDGRPMLPVWPFAFY
jgi:hypothetical protein